MRIHPPSAHKAGAHSAEIYALPLTIHLLSGWLAQRFPGIDRMTRSDKLVGQIRGIAPPAAPTSTHFTRGEYS